MKILIDFKCPNGHIQEEYTNRDTQTVRCNTCGTSASRVISPVRSLMEPFSGHFHDSARKWAKHHEEMAKKTEEA